MQLKRSATPELDVPTARAGGPDAIVPLSPRRLARTGCALGLLCLLGCSSNQTSDRGIAGSPAGSAGASESSSGGSASASGGSAQGSGGLVNAGGTSLGAAGAAAGAGGANSGSNSGGAAGESVAFGGSAGAVNAASGGTAGAGNPGGPSGGLGGTATRPLLTAAQAADLSVLKYLEKAGNLGTGLSVDNWDPTVGAGDVASMIASYTVAAAGGSHTRIQDAISAATTAGGSSRVYILVTPGTYRELVCVPSGAPPITLYGADADASKVVIVNNNSNGKLKLAEESANPCSPNAGKTTYGTAGSATVAVFAKEFHAKNLTFANDFDETGVTSGAQAVALLTQADRLVFENVRLLGNQDTLYFKTSDVSVVSRVYFKGCYVEGDVDFIFGRGTAVFDACTIHYLNARQGSKGGYAISPSTDYRVPYGVLVTKSSFTAEAGTPAGIVYLGRAWDESQVDVTTYGANVQAAMGGTGTYPNGQALIRESILGEHIRLAGPWGPAATTSRPYSSTTGTVPANRLYEYANTGTGAAP